MTDDVLAEFEPRITAAEEAEQVLRDHDAAWSPWVRRDHGALEYVPNLELLHDLLGLPRVWLTPDL